MAKAALTKTEATTAKDENATMLNMIELQGDKQMICRGGISEWFEEFVRWFPNDLYTDTPASNLHTPPGASMKADRPEV